MLKKRKSFSIEEIQKETRNFLNQRNSIKFSESPSQKISLSKPRNEVELLISEHEIEKLKSLVEQNPKILFESEKNCFLHFACEYNFLDIIEFLIQCGLDVNKTDKYFRTPIHISCNAGNLEAVLLLCGYRAKLNIRDTYGNHPIHLIFKSKHYHLLDSLLLFNADINTKKSDGSTILHDLMKYSDFEGLNFLLSSPIENLKFNQKDQSGYTPFLRGFTSRDEMNCIICMELFLSKDVYLLALNDNKQNFLHIASRSSTWGAAKYVLKKSNYSGELKELLFQKDIYGSTPLHIAVTSGDEDAIESLILLCPKSINEKDVNGDTPLHLALRSRLSCVELMQKSGANLNIKNAKGISIKQMLKEMK
jgi:ankyrin repeat protein